jgi:hypothetical protein
MAGETVEVRIAAMTSTLRLRKCRERGSELYSRRPLTPSLVGWGGIRRSILHAAFATASPLAHRQYRHDLASLSQPPPDSPMTGPTAMGSVGGPDRRVQNRPDSGIAIDILSQRLSTIVLLRHFSSHRHSCVSE